MFNPYGAGQKVYRGGSNAATFGTVNPSGYIERELRRRNGMTQPSLYRRPPIIPRRRQLGNPSQTRSGLAAAALRRLHQMRVGNNGGPGPAGPPNTAGIKTRAAGLVTDINASPELLASVLKHNPGGFTAKMGEDFAANPLQTVQNRAQKFNANPVGYLEHHNRPGLANAIKAAQAGTLDPAKVLAAQSQFTNTPGVMGQKLVPQASSRAALAARAAAKLLAMNNRNAPRA